MRIGTASALLVLLAAPSAQAELAVSSSLAHSLAHSCYVAAQRGYPSAYGEQTCTLSLNQELLSARDRAATFINRGVLRTGLRAYEAAMADYGEAIAAGNHLAPSDLGVAYVDRASTLNAMGLHREALDSANRGLNLGAGNSEVGFYARAVAEEMLGNYKAAYYDYKQAIAIRPDFAPAARQLTRFRVESRPGSGA